jgi:hypothetical protein
VSIAKQRAFELLMKTPDGQADWMMAVVGLITLGDAYEATIPPEQVTCLVEEWQGRGGVLNPDGDAVQGAVDARAAGDVAGEAIHLLLRFI